MPRISRNAKLEARGERLRLQVRKEPHWHKIFGGCYLGYRRNDAGGSWSARRICEGKRYEVKWLGLADDFAEADGVSTLSYQAAHKLACDFFQEEERARRGLSKNKRFTVKDAMEEYFAEYQRAGKSLDNCAKMKSVIETHIVPTLGAFIVAELTTEQLVKWRNNLSDRKARGSDLTKRLLKGKKKGAKIEETAEEKAERLRKRRASTNRALNILKAALNSAWRTGKVKDDSAWRRLSSFRAVDVARVRYLTEAQAAQLLDACSAEFRPLVEAALYTGARYGELTALKVRNYDKRRSAVHIEKSKSGKPRSIYLNQEGRAFFSGVTEGRDVDELIFLRADGTTWGRADQTRPMLKACTDAEVPTVNFHALRHTYATLALTNGMPMRILCEQLGHRDERMIYRHYGHVISEYRDKVIKKHAPSFGIKRPSSAKPDARVH